MPPLSEVLSTSLPPIVAALLLVSWRGARLTALAMALGVFVAWWWNSDWQLPPWPHQLLLEPRGILWLLWSLVGLGLVTTLEHARVLRGRVAVGTGVVFVALATFLMLQKVAGWSAGQTLLYIGGGGFVVALTVLATRTSLSRAPATIAPAVVFSVLLSLLSVVMVVGMQNGPLGRLAGAVGATLGAAAGTWLWRKPFALTAADGTWIGGAWGLLVIAGVHLTADPSLGAAACAMLSPFALLLLPPSVAQRPARWTTAALVLAGAPMVGALAFALAAHPNDGY